MTERSTIHDTFTLTRRLPASPARVWDAYADPAKKKAWFTSAPGGVTAHYSLEFREGGSESWSGTFGDSPVIELDARYIDVVPETRIIISYAMKIGGNRISVSTQTTEMRPDGDGTLLTLTEYGAYLDGFDDPGLRVSGTEDLLRRLEEFVAKRN